MNLRFPKLAIFATCMSAALLGPGAPDAFGQQGYVQYYDPSAPLPKVPVVLDTRMRPTYVRTREVETSSGVTERVTEPIIQERFERVSKPMIMAEKTVATESSTSAKTVKSQPVRRAYRSASRRSSTRVAYRARRSPSRVAYRSTARRSSSNQVATRSRTVIQERVVSEAAIFERRDPALNVLDQAPSPGVDSIAGRAKVRVTETY